MEPGVNINSMPFSTSQRQLSQRNDFAKDPFLQDDMKGGYDTMDPQCMEYAKSVATISPVLLKLFPAAFLMFCFGAFVVPLALILQLSLDPTVKKFMPVISGLPIASGIPLIWLGWIIPALFVATFLIHTIRGGRPSRLAISITLIGSCLLLLVLTYSFLLAIYKKSPILASSDCKTWPEKRKIQEEWELARGFYATCVSEKAKAQKLSFAAAVTEFRMKDCEGYSKQMEKHKDWEFLEYLEQYQNCAGWCVADQPMWTKEPTKDACSPVVASIFRDKIEYCMKQVGFYSLLALMMFTIIILTSKPLVTKLGLQW
jgi:hypothetical protein